MGQNNKVPTDRGKKKEEKTGCSFTNTVGICFDILGPKELSFDYGINNHILIEYKNVKCAQIQTHILAFFSHINFVEPGTSTG